MIQMKKLVGCIAHYAQMKHVGISCTLEVLTEITF
jgi:hypothetical protein